MSWKMLPLLFQGLQMTLIVLFFSSIISFFTGIFFGIFPCKIVQGITFVLRAIPFYVLLLLAYFVLPDLLGLDIDAFSASVIALGFCSAAYVAEIIRGGVVALGPRPWEIAESLGFSRLQCLRYVILPQVLRHQIPTLTNEFESLLKSTAILSSIGVLELTRVGSNIVAREMQPIAIYSTVALFYVAISLIIRILSKFLERKVSYARS